MHPSPRKTKLAAKKHRILNEVFRSRSASRFELAQKLNINATMVSTYVEELLEYGYLIEENPASGSRGRAPIPLKANPDYGCLMGLDFEALRARVVLSDFGGDILAKKEIFFPKNPTREGVIADIKSLALELGDQAQRPIVSFGVAAPGLVDSSRGQVLHYSLIPDFDDIDLITCFENVLTVEPFVEDNNRAMAYAELLRGAGQGCQDFLHLAIRSGVALGIVIGGKLHYGANSLSGQLGSNIWHGTGGRETVRDVVSVTGFVNSIRRLLTSRRNPPARQALVNKGELLELNDIATAADDGDEFLAEQLDLLGKNLGEIAVNLSMLFAPEKIVLGGDIPMSMQRVRESMESTFHRFRIQNSASAPILEDGQLGGFAGALGAAWMGFPRLFPEDEGMLIQQQQEP